MITKSKVLTALGALAPFAVFAEGENAVTVPGLDNAITTATNTASSMAASIVPAAVTIIFAFAGIMGVWAVWKLLKRGVKGA